MSRIEKNKIPNVLKATESGIVKALTAGALIVHGEATLRCPVGDTGNLRASLDYILKPTEARIGTNTEYAPYLEHGTSKMNAQPYLRPALDNNKGNIEKAMSSILKQAIEGATK